MITEFLKVLLNIRSLRAALRELSLEQLQEAHEKIESIYLERAEQAEKEQAARSEHVNKLAEFQAMLAEAGIDPSELVQAMPAGKGSKVVRESGKRTPRPAKCRYVENGVEKTWTGQGRMPKYLAEQQAQGRQLDEFLI